MKSGNALLDAWENTLTRCAANRAIYNTRGEIVRTFGNIEERAIALERSIDSLQSGEALAIQLGNHPDWPSLLLACMRRKVIVVPLETSISEQQRNAAFEICGASAVAVALSGDMIELRTFRENAAHRAAATAWGENTPVLLKLTSGTTAAPRVIRFRSEQLLADCDNICDTMDIKDADINFGVIPVSHSYGFSNLITPLIARAVPMVLSTDRMPRAVLDDLACSNATVFPSTPAFFQALCETANLPALPNLRLCISAGAPLSASTARKFFEKYHKPVHSFYGASECGGICYDRVGTTFENGFAGEPMSGVDVQLIDETAAASQVRVRSAAVGDGYFPEPDETKLGNGSFLPDDLMTRSGKGFRIAGRISDLINVAGKKVNPAEVENVLLKHKAVREAVVFGRASLLRNEEVAACVVAIGASESELLTFCRSHLSDWQTPKRIFFVDALPVSERGKVSRRELAQKLGA